MTEMEEKLWKALEWIDQHEPELVAGAEAKFGFSLADPYFSVIADPHGIDRLFDALKAEDKGK